MSGAAMPLTTLQISRMSKLLDEALPLDEAGRRRWLQRLPPEHQDLSQALQHALLPGDGQTPELELLRTMPKFATLGAGAAAAVSGLQPGAAVGPYRLIRLLGAGGMAEVWLAERVDGAFKRQVALKVPMLTGMRRDLEQRFAVERDILASLEHPHIARLYDAGIDAAGWPYLCMEFVQGEPITEWCDTRRLDVGRRLRLFLQVLQAVQYAHDRHVIHRDLKPSNILITHAGEVRLLDFGVAKLLQNKDAGQKTELTGVYGRALTPIYASPEQLLGNPVDVRSDIYSLGVLLYELLCGAKPHSFAAGASPAVLAQAILTTDAKKPSSQPQVEASALRGARPAPLSRQLRGDLDTVALKALANEPARRYAMASEMAEDLERHLTNRPIAAKPARFSYRLRKFAIRNRAILAVAGAAGAGILATAGYALHREIAANAASVAGRMAASSLSKSPISSKSIAVLPFLDLSEKRDQEYFSDGLSEELIDQLAQIKELQVTARTSSFYFKGKQITIADIAKALEVAHVLEGSVRKAGNSVRVTAQLIRADSGMHLWSQTFDRDVKDVFSVQDEIAAGVVSALKLTLLSGDRRKDPRRSDNPEAYDRYMRGDHLIDNSDGRAIALLNQSVQLDPEFALAWSKLSIAYSKAALYGTVLDVDLATARMRARSAAETAVRLDPQLADAYTATAYAEMLALDWNAALRNVESAESLDPTSHITLNMRGNLDFHLGRFQDAVDAARQAIERDPLDYNTLCLLAGSLSAMGRHREAEQVYRRVIEINPVLEEIHGDIAQEMIFDKRPDKALAEAKLEPNPDIRTITLAIVYYSLGRKADSDAMLSAIETQHAGDRAGDIAFIYGFRGETERAFQWLNRANAQHEPTLSTIKGNIGILPNIARDPRYHAILREMHLPD
jgi:eukaryotic-like serine/threonine-protein kinase